MAELISFDTINQELFIEPWLPAGLCDSHREDAADEKRWVPVSKKLPAGEEIQIHNVQTYNFKWEVLYVLIFIISQRIFDSIGGSETTNNK